jgi:hypothetical protein
MGRADIAILSEISFRIRLCLHPPALSMEGLAYDDGSLSRPLDFCRDTSDVSRRETAPSHLITHIILRAQSLRGHMGRSFSTCDGHTTTIAITGPPYGRTASVLVAPVSIRPRFNIPERVLPGDVNHL